MPTSNRNLTLFLIGIFLFPMASSALGQRMTEREARRFMGLYRGSQTVLLRSEGEQRRRKQPFQFRARWRPRGDDATRFEFGEFRPIFTRTRIGYASISSKSILSGNYENPETGNFGSIRGTQNIVMKRKGVRRYLVKMYLRLHFGSEATFAVRGRGRK